MILPTSVTIPVRPRIKLDGTTIHSEPVTSNQLSLTIIDRPESKTVAVLVSPFMKPLLLWSGDEYVAIGDYTQAQVEARVLERLGPNLQAGIDLLNTTPLK